MITEAQVRELVERHLAGSTHFLVAVELRPGKLVVEVDDDRAITLNELAALNRAVREELGTAADNCEISFSSPGMGRPFKVMRQYQKHIGRIVDITLNDGRALHGQLSSLNGSTLGLRIQHPPKVKGRPPKLDEEATIVPLADIKSTQATITFN